MNYTLSYKNDAIGPNGFSPIFLFNCRFILSPPTSYIFNASLQSGSFPALLKSTDINSIYKKSDISLVTSYYPINIISIILKIFSKIVNYNLTLIF